MEEIWKDVKGYEGYYQVSNLGRVKGLLAIKQYKCGRILKTFSNCKGKGYLKVKLYKNTVKKMFYVHRLVADAFLPNPYNYPDINHKDENPHNNSVNNIEWCNESYNMSYGTTQERRRETYKRKRLLRAGA